MLTEAGSQESVQIPSDGILTKNLFVYLKDTWINNNATQVVIGDDADYHCCYLPVDISGYNTISVTAQEEFNSYFQFFKNDNLNGICGTRIMVEKGQTLTTEIPSDAKYLVVAHSRDNLSASLSTTGYGLYFPADLRISTSQLR